jgi:hypothetical protein
MRRQHEAAAKKTKGREAAEDAAGGGYNFEQIACDS